MMWLTAIGLLLIILGAFVWLMYADTRTKSGEPSPEETLDAEISNSFLLPDHDLIRAAKEEQAKKTKMRLVARR